MKWRILDNVSSRVLNVIQSGIVISTERGTSDEKSQAIQYLNVYLKPLLVVFIFASSLSVLAQKQQLQWLTFSELETALVEQPKKVLIHFYADWCSYCRKMEKVVYTKPEVEAELNTNYYAVKFNVESQDTITFGGKTFLNLNAGKKRLAYHQIPELLAGRPNQPLELPAIVVLDKAFNIEKRFYRYIPPKEILAILKE